MSILPKQFLTEQPLTDPPRMGILEDYPFHDTPKRAEFHTRPWFWESLMPAEHVLLFSADSMLRSQSPFSIDDFLKYDLIDTPLAPADPDYDKLVGISVGQPLRNRNAMVNMARETDWRKTASAYRDENRVIRKAFEDEWFWDKLVAEPVFF